MDKQKTFSDSVLEFNAWLANISLELFDNYTISNPFNGKNKDKIKEITKTFYKKYYNDNHSLRLIFGSSPARKGTAVTGVPFEDASLLQNETGIFIDEFYINKTTTTFFMTLFVNTEVVKNFIMIFI